MDIGKIAGGVLGALFTGGSPLGAQAGASLGGLFEGILGNSKKHERDGQKDNNAGNTPLSNPLELLGQYQNLIGFGGGLNIFGK